MNRSDCLNIIQSKLQTIYEKLDNFFYKNSDRTIRTSLRENINLCDEFFNITRIQGIINFECAFQNIELEIKNNIINQIKKEIIK